MKRLEQFTFTRFIASVLIVTFHYGSGYFPFNVKPWTRVVSTSTTLVIYFFVLSGFILTWVYYPRDGEKIAWLPFIVKRVARFYPLYFVAILAMIPFRFGDDAHTLTGLVLDIFLLQTWVPKYALALHGPAWAMSVFLFLYVIFPFALTWFVRKGLRFSAFFIIGFWVVSQVTVHRLYDAYSQNLLDLNINFLMYFPLWHVGSFLLGVLGGMVFIDRSKKTILKSQKNGVWLGASFLLFLAYFYFRSDLYTVFGIRLVFYAGLHAPLFLALIYFLAKDTGRVTHFLSRKWLVRLGNISFTIYLLQSPLVQVYQTYLLDRFERYFPWTAEVHFYLYLAMLIVTAFVVFNFYEQPAHKAILRLYARLCDRWSFPEKSRLRV